MAAQGLQLGIVLRPIYLFVAKVWKALFQQVQSCVDIAQSRVAAGGIILRHQVIGVDG